jgi:hypothetical protein
MIEAGFKLSEISEDLISKTEEAWKKEFEISQEREALAERRKELLIELQGGQEAVWAREIEAEQQRMELARERELLHQEMLYGEQVRQITHMEEMLGIEQQGIDASFNQWQSGLQGRLELFRGFFGQLAVLQQGQSKAAFYVGKAAAISEAIIQGILGAQKSYTAMSGIPYVGPALGIIAASAALAGMAINVKKIASTKYGQASAAITGGTGFSMSGASAPSGPIGPQGTGGGGTTVVQLNLDGEQIHEAIVNNNNSALQQNRPAFAQAG